MDDLLKKRIEQQIRERIQAERAKTNGRIAKRFRETGDFRDEPQIEQFFRDGSERDVTHTLPFALEIAERDRVADRLSDDQYNEAGLRAAQASLANTLTSFENRVRQNAPAMTPEKLQKSEAILAMFQSHTAMMNERFSDSANITETDLEETAQKIPADISELGKGKFGA